MRHTITREGDEHACSCGLRWGVGETDPHTYGERSAWTQETLNDIARETLDNLIKDLKP